MPYPLAGATAIEPVCTGSTVFERVGGCDILRGDVTEKDRRDPGQRDADRHEGEETAADRPRVRLD